MLTRATRTTRSDYVATSDASDARLHSGIHHWFASGDDWCAAAWHAAPRPVSRVAVLCPSIALEQSRGHRDFRVLATRLAAAGVSTLRFDYPATGNSTGDSLGGEGAAADLAARWSAGIVDAVAHARRLAPGAEIVLVGRRLGALLAATASAVIDGGVVACVMWDPSVSGTAHLRELRLREAARLHVLFANELDRVEPGIAFQSEGWRFDDATVEGISSLALERAAPHAEVVHLIGAVLVRALRAVDRWRVTDHGPRIATHTTADSSFDWTHPEGDTLPEETFAAIQRIAVGDARLDGDAAPARVSVDGCDEIAISGAAGVAYRERLLRFGERDACFGMHSAPASDESVACAVLILGTGIEPTPSVGDAWTRFARSAAVRGYAVLRMDYRGIGDSIVRNGARENVSYDAGRAGDVRAGVDWLRLRWPNARVVVVGVCTGGYYGVHAVAAGLEVEGLIAINPQLWCTDTSTMDQQPSVDLVLARRSAAAAHDVGKWLRLMRGGYRSTDVVHAVRGLVRRLAASMRIGEPARMLGDGMPRLDFKRLFPGLVETHLIFSQDDNGYEHLLAHGARAATRLFATPHVTLHLIRAVDHTFSREWMRRRLDEEVFVALEQAQVAASSVR
ncbi:MAG: alpha/beta fold hydrolase [Gemmatimonadaceae bacterium]